MYDQTQSESEEQIMAEAITKEKIRRAMLAGPSCVPGDQNIIGSVDMCLDPMGMVWMKDVMARKPRPTNTSPGLIYMLNGATQHSYTDPFDTTSPAIPIGPHWMILWPFDAKAAGLGTVMRDAGALVMFEIGRASGRGG